MTTRSGEISAVNPDGFSVEWLFPATEEVVCGDSPQPRKLDLKGIYGAAQVDEMQVYVGAYDGNVYALDRENGTCNWIFETDDPIVGGLTLVGSDLYVPSQDNHLYLIDTTDGSLVESFDAGDSVWVTPLVDDGVVYITTVGGDAYALDADTLEPLWDKPFSVEAGLISDPVISDGTVIVGGIGGTLYALDAANGDERWSFEGDNWFWARPLVDNGAIYAPDLDGNVYALTLDGAAVWQAPFKAENSIRSSPVIADGSLIVIDTKGNAMGVDTADGISLWPAPVVLNHTVHSNPMVIDGSVFVVAQGGDFFQFNSDGGGLRRIEVAA